jgi:hypothetical protein
MAKFRSCSVPAVTSRMQSRHPMGNHWQLEVNPAKNERQIEEFLISFQRSAACKFNVLTFFRACPRYTPRARNGSVGFGIAGSSGRNCRRKRFCFNKKIVLPN